MLGVLGNQKGVLDSLNWSYEQLFTVVQVLAVEHKSPSRAVSALKG